MPKQLTANQLSNLSSQKFTHSSLLQLGTRYLTTSHRTVSYNGNDYLSTVDILKLPKSYYGLDDTLTFSTIKISMAQTVTNYNLLLLNNSVNLKIVISLVLNSEVYTVFDGIVESLSLSNRQIEITGRYLWNRYNNFAGRKHTSASQNRYFPGDKGLDFASTLEKRKVEWGNN